MRVLILGISGMLGHKLYSYLKDNTFMEVFGTVRSSHKIQGLNRDNVIEGVDVSDLGLVEGIVKSIKPDYLVNAVGIIKQIEKDTAETHMIEINSLLPHKIAEICLRNGCKPIFISTDCVFSGDVGEYSELDNPDPVDLYGRTKLIGEVESPGALTIRTSIIGPEIGTKYGLLEWFLSQKGQVKGYSGAIYTGFPTVALAGILNKYVFYDRRYNLEGVVHISSDPINKYDLLCLIRDTYNLDIEIEEFGKFKCDRSLLSIPFRKETGFVPTPWKQMVEEMYKDHIAGDSIYDIRR